MLVWLRHSCSYKKTTVVLVGLLAFACCAFVGFKNGLPVPTIHDEFSYLLAADTFASGRLTNPTHPMWKHFEALYELQKPTYMSKYPPMQGVFLAVGQKFFGHPIWGVWLSLGLMCAAICWMLQSWVSPLWAFIGSLIVIFHPCIGPASYWAQSYWGGAIAAMGGAMVLGGAHRIAKKLNVFDAVIMGLGMAVLINSRPFESPIIIIPVLGLLFYWFFWGKKNLRSLFIRSAVLPVLIIGLLTALVMGYYNKNITGNAFVMPYFCYEQKYTSNPALLWMKLRPEPKFNNEQMKDYNERFFGETYAHFSKMNFFQIVYERWSFQIMPAITGNCWLSIPLFLGLCSFVSGDKWMIFIVCILIFYVFLQALSCWFFLHYMAPLMPLSIILLIYGFRVLFCQKIRKVPIGKVVTILYLVFFFCLGVLDMNKTVLVNKHEWNRVRQKIINAFKKTGDKHLILVDYGFGNSGRNVRQPYNEWVYNEADINKAKIVWARSLGKASDQELLEYFKDRRIWILSTDQVKLISKK